MPRKGKRSEAAKGRWRKLDLADVQSSPPTMVKKGDAERPHGSTFPSNIEVKSVCSHIEQPSTTRAPVTKQHGNELVKDTKYHTAQNGEAISTKQKHLQECVSVPRVMSVQASHCQGDASRREEDQRTELKILTAARTPAKKQQTRWARFV